MASSNGNFPDVRSLRSVKSSQTLKVANQGLKLGSKGAASPTLSVNLGNTIGDTSLLPTGNDDSQYEDNSGGSLPRILSIGNLSVMDNSLRSLSSAKRYGTASNSISREITRDTATSGPAPIIQNDADVYGTNTPLNTTPFDRNTDVGGAPENLIDMLAESIYSYAPSMINGKSAGAKRPYVSNEIPNVFSVTERDVIDQDSNSALNKQDKNFLIISYAGKPIYAMHGRDEQVVSFSGIINTIVSYFQVNNEDSIKTITSTNTGQKFAFLNKDPIILMAYSTRGETTSELLDQLDFLYSYLLSSVTERQLHKLFSRRSNFDLRTFLEHTDFENLNDLCLQITNRLYPDLLLNALQSNPLRKSVRAKIHDAILNQLSGDSDLIPRGTLLYGLLLSTRQSKLTAVVRPRGHTLHTTDLQLLFCLVRRHMESGSASKEFWIPVCFPKFNSTGFLYAYIRFLSPEDKSAMVLISAQKDAFFKLKLFGDRLWERLVSDKLTTYIVPRGGGSARCGFRVRDIPAPLVHHFVYKSRRFVQYVMPEVDYNVSGNNPFLDESESSGDPEGVVEYQRKLQSYYQQLHDSVVYDDGDPINKSMLSFVKWSCHGASVEVVGLAWVTPQFELYLLCNDGVRGKEVALRSARRVVSWCRKHEARLFIHDGAVF
ncbi:guanine nucleotide exchange factor MON1 KNAG_0F02490 [Huiozyma naganishii CBS 8797]|uniref:Vacuolar fusion protein MON1 n=1 Tax=Huiozyma naganishii (strain ATCC MYA-139 / BCRC 22969 / CBS 8797 / KCTC 17520 / NBRC 10181 / NCYC 3082 / Yp74L-3) TaxID=1071383 RepID=J7S7D5_HUIN7|nr:hypothetical protein KNAG_0F02490 [Kazachstania naganishii CBS 8797]CCK70914.1 hypothetical protein KNAG_0F02490 [Kazachstania naganishii CBS 8797]